MLAKQIILPAIALPALTVLFGIQLLRALLPYLQYLLGDRLGLTAIQLGVVALIIFSTSFLAQWLNRWLGLRRLFILSAGGVGLARLLSQLWRGDPIGDMVLAMLGTALFLLFLPAYLVLTRRAATKLNNSRYFAQAILLGLAVDTALHGLFLTYDFIWQSGMVVTTLTVVLVSSQWLTLRTAPVLVQPRLAPAKGPTLATWPWLAAGPFLFLHLLIFQNQARLITLTGWSPALVLGWMLTGHLLGLSLVTLWRPGRWASGLLSLLLVGSLWPFEATGGLGAAVPLFLGTVAAAVLLGVILQKLGREPGQSAGPPHPAEESMWQTTLIHGGSMVLLVGLIFAFYVPFSLPVPYQNGWLLPVAGLLVGLCGTLASATQNRQATFWPWQPGLLWPWLLLLGPVFMVAAGRTPPPVVQPAGSIRVFTYNVHAGINTAGQLDLEELAREIEAEQPDVVALQELSRGWVVNGSVDMLSWLAKRLNMAYAFTPSSDLLWGQAVLSRYPILLSQTYPLPPRDIPLKRSFGYYQIDTGQPAPLQLVNTHWHHPEQAQAIRIGQAEVVLDFVDGYQFERFLLTGDLNATPGTPEIALLYQRGFKDVVAEAGLRPGYTFKASNPFKRLDYLLISPDLAAAQVVIPQTTASDHLGIVATIKPQTP